ncbi:MAG: peptidase M15 [Balneola sp.]|nr:peptidase M15 [Balneola sp.]|tara:strand:+ start:21185 stop:21553 length:369 start_codon:yes stop_codon:yes gene_type:complete
MRYDYFSQNDFDTAIPVCKMSDMDEEFMEKLDLAREIARVPFIVNSAYRTVEYEKSKGRDGSSSHTKGLAVDLKCTLSRVRFRILHGLLQAGFTRIGVGKTFIHVDFDQDKDQQVVWDYYKD